MYMILSSISCAVFIHSKIMSAVVEHIIGNQELLSWR